MSTINGNEPSVGPDTDCQVGEPSRHRGSDGSPPPAFPSGVQTPASLPSGIHTPVTPGFNYSTDRLITAGPSIYTLDRSQDESPVANSPYTVGSSIEQKESRLHAHPYAPSNSVLERRITRRDDSAIDTSLSHVDHAQNLHRRLSGLPPSRMEIGRNVTEFEIQDVKTAQGKPPELANLLAEVVFILICSMGQLLFALLLGNVTVNQITLLKALGITAAQTPWITGSFLLANGLSVVISGSLADLAGPKAMMVGAFVWLVVWNIIGVFSVTPARSILFFIVRAMQGLAVGVLVSSSMSVLGRIYKPGIRKNRVFSSMAAMAPFGFWIGCLQGGALSAHLPWIFGSSAILSGACAVAGYLTIPDLQPAKDSDASERVSIKQFDYLGASCAVLGCGCCIFGLTQGAPSGWQPYTYSMIIVGVAFFVAFYFAERYAKRPLIDNRLWLTPSFAPLIISYFLGFGSYVGSWQFYAVRFWLTLQNKSPIIAALYLTPNAIVGVLATWVVSKTLHLVPGNYIFTASMVAFAMGPVFFLPQTANTSYWALSMPGIALVTFGPDLSFAAASIFITSSVPKSYQGSAGSLLVTVQNLAAAIMTAVGDSIGDKVTTEAEGELTLEALRAIWWFSFAIAICSAVLCALTVRIPKSEEKEHMT